LGDKEEENKKNKEDKPQKADGGQIFANPPKIIKDKTKNKKGNKKN